MKKKIPLILLTILVLNVVGFFVYKQFFTSKPGANHKIVLTEDGFKPDTITIHKGDTITFSTNRGKPYWPASNIHPTHGIYPEFDPLDAVMPNKTWTFKFDKVGTWAFHDHLAPYFIGRITVNPI